jgi:hypothetical protein
MNPNFLPLSQQEDRTDFVVSVTFEAQGLKALLPPKKGRGFRRESPVPMLPLGSTLIGSALRGAGNALDPPPLKTTES